MNVIGQWARTRVEPHCDFVVAIQQCFGSLRILENVVLARLDGKDTASILTLQGLNTVGRNVSFSYEACYSHRFTECLQAAHQRKVSCLPAQDILILAFADLRQWVELCLGFLGM